MDERVETKNSANLWQKSCARRCFPGVCPRRLPRCAEEFLAVFRFLRRCRSSVLALCKHPRQPNSGSKVRRARFLLFRLERISKLKGWVVGCIRRAEKRFWASPSLLQATYLLLTLFVRQIDSARARSNSVSEWVHTHCWKLTSISPAQSLQQRIFGVCWTGKFALGSSR